MERSVGEHMTESSQPCPKGQNRDKISALEAAYEGYRIKENGAQSAATEARPITPLFVVL